MSAINDATEDLHAVLEAWKKRHPAVKEISSWPETEQIIETVGPTMIETVQVKGFGMLVVWEDGFKPFMTRREIHTDG